MKVTATHIECAVARHFNPRVNLVVPNICWGLNLHECDLLIMSQSGYLTEIEIKISAADLKKDAFKRHGHADDRIKKLYFAVPEKLMKYESLIPERAGIIVYKSESDYCGIIREAKTNDAAKPLRIDDQYQFARLGALRIWGLKRKIINLQEKQYA